MNEVKFLKKDAITFGWETVTGNLGFFIGVLFILLAAAILPQILAGVFAKAGILVLIIALAGAVLQVELRMGVVKSLIAFADGKKPVIGDLFSCFDKRIVTLFVAGILYSLMIFIGTLLLIVPGIILGIQFMFFAYFIVDKNAGIMESLRKSSELTSGSKTNIFLLALLLWLINAAGALCLGIGLIITIPLSMAAVAYVYRKLEGGSAAPQVEAQVV
ncbi:MAG: hypothetical protein CVU78_07170 [Elusimicrobia bacterium HGW-Elusimicrobia-2]|nr:MAG: hypothetical protein CVU78_07170 [Elusimicrobia bacterium HGW-Elusimicrobia-2]